MYFCETILKIKIFLFENSVKKMGVEDFLTTFEVITIVVTIYSIFISTPIYISVLVYIRKNSGKPPFNSPFFTCFFVLGVIDLICYWLYIIKKLQFWDVIIPFFKPYNTPTITCSIVYFIIWFTGMSQWELNILISLNRFVSLMFPDIYQKYWTSKHNRIYIALVFVICFLTTLQLVWLPVQISPSIIITSTGNITKYTGPVFKNPSDSALYGWIWKGHIYILLGICFFCYIPMFIKIRKYDLKDQTKKKQYEIKMLYTLISLLIANFFYICFLISRDYLTAIYTDYGRFSEWSLYILADIYDLHNPYNLLVTSKKVRWSSFPFFLFKKQTSKQTTMKITISQKGNVGGKHVIGRPLKICPVAPLTN
ncbi:hypothetical protein Mgra_00003792 [Meloidogyne graminicola]|uniref:Serpentine receptor class gamma n=1 Tax=Meloidogyne graminicola TaxID=189291 RepID=A0A8S9ZUG9_9BILA|nr:hypothetical protein Mgra_00003792 [Meloidogyne graminicola]